MNVWKTERDEEIKTIEKFRMQQVSQTGWYILHLVAVARRQGDTKKTVTLIAYT